MAFKRFTIDATSTSKTATARQTLRTHLNSWNCEQVDDGLLVLTELVTNAIRHGGGATRIDVEHGPEFYASRSTTAATTSRYWQLAEADCSRPISVTPTR